MHIFICTTGNGDPPPKTQPTKEPTETPAKAK